MTFSAKLCKNELHAEVTMRVLRDQFKMGHAFNLRKFTICNCEALSVEMWSK